MTEQANPGSSPEMSLADWLSGTVQGDSGLCSEYEFTDLEISAWLGTVQS